jgi:hypothetical protein
LHNIHSNAFEGCIALTSICFPFNADRFSTDWFVDYPGQFAIYLKDCIMQKDRNSYSVDILD